MQGTFFTVLPTPPVLAPITPILTQPQLFQPHDVITVYVVAIMIFVSEKECIHFPRIRNYPYIYGVCVVF